VNLHDFIERKKLLAILLLALGSLMLLLDILNPFTEFLKTWNIVYVLANFFAFLAPLAVVYIVLGFLVEKEDTARLFFSCLWIPVIHYFLKGFLLLHLIGQDPNLLVEMGSDIGWHLEDWKDFAVFYYGSFPLFVVSIWAFSIVFMTLGVLLNFTFGESLRRIAKSVLRKVKGA